MTDRLIEKIQQRKIRLAVLGIGYVGLPTAALFANAGFNVDAVDIRKMQVDLVNKGFSPIDEPGLKEYICQNVKDGRLKAILEKDYLYDADGFLITVQTPISESNVPDLSYLLNAVERISSSVKKDSIVAVCSTIPPGTMKTIRTKLEHSSNLVAGLDFCLAYVPERIAPGKALTEFIHNTRLVGGIGEKSTCVTLELFKNVCKNLTQTDAVTAEIAKLAENTFRDVNIAFANQLALLCETKEADVMKVIQLANTHPRVKIHFPGPGVGGPCLTKDPYLLTCNSNFIEQDVIKISRILNNFMPKHVVELASKALASIGRPIIDAHIVVLGTAYKADVDDSRYSPSEIVIQDLLRLGANVTAYDPYCSECFGAEKSSSLLSAVKDSDCMIIMVDHKQFNQMDFKEIYKLMSNQPVIVDCRRIIDPHLLRRIGFVYYGIGFGVT